ncbi:toxin-activating lysine-acyltransferase [Ruegeria atlantica]|uniref:toxin-activating lysine-acyltransferase n=1 Tax=Ruegeria atlantica TaxID=81569 RepID=UPI00147B8916|nr:toxin-activating lysine-acyltransferase [Ruegeria atlantica]
MNVKPDQNLPNPERMKQIGQICFLVSQSRLHGAMRYRQIERRLFYPLSIGQGRLFMQGENAPLSFVTWAWVNEEVDARLTNDPDDIKPNEWNCGEHLWFMDFIAPYGRVREIITHLDQELFHSVSYAKLHRIGMDDGQSKRVARYYGSKRREERKLSQK